jgi:hypothetical protein
MACSIVISSVSGTKVGATLTSIQVTGTVVGCNQVNVTIRCGGTPVTHPATITGGNWSVTFNSADIATALCQCNQNIIVSAQCAGTPPPCSAAPQTLVLECKPCCDVKVSPTVDFNCVNGKRTVTFHVLNNCPLALNAQFHFGDGSPVSSVSLAPGTSNVTHAYLPGTYTAVVKITGCPDIPVTFTVEPCPPCCKVEVSAAVDTKCDNDKRKVTLQVINSCPTALNAQCDFGDGSPAISVSLAPGTNTITHMYGPGTYTAVIHVFGCPDKSVTFTVPPCCCPKITTNVEVGECNVEGKTKVCLTTTADVPAGCKVTMQWDFGDGQTGGSHTFNSGSNTFTECHDYAPGSYTAQLNIVSPSGCKSSSVSINVPPCDCCPDISVVPCVEDCVKGNRLVTFTITVNAKPSPCPDVEVQMDFGDDNTGGTHSFPPSGSGSYIETHTYSGSSALQDNTATLNVIQPQGCPGWSMVIPKCCKKKLVNWCTILFNTMTGALALALVLLLLLLLCSVPISNSVIWGLLIVFVVALIIFLFLKCPKCRCGWLFLLLWRVLSGVGLLFAIFSGCHPPTHDPLDPNPPITVPDCSPWSFWIGLGLLILGIVFLLLWKKKCCVKRCAFWAEIILWIGATILPLVGIIYSFSWGANCLYILFTIPWLNNFQFTFWALVLIIWGFLLAYFMKNCTKQ